MICFLPVLLSERQNLCKVTESPSRQEGASALQMLQKTSRNCYTFLQLCRQVFEEVVVKNAGNAKKEMGVDAVLLEDSIHRHARTTQFASQPRHTTLLARQFILDSFANTNHTHSLSEWRGYKDKLRQSFRLNYLKWKRRESQLLVPLVEALAKPILGRTSNAEPTPVRLYIKYVHVTLIRVHKHHASKEYVTWIYNPPWASIAALFSTKK